MLKYFKYELKNNYKILIINILVGIISTIFVAKYDELLFNDINLFSTIAIIVSFVVGLSIFFAFGKILAILLNDFYNPTGYFTFALPIKTYKILLGKILFSMFYIYAVVYSMKFSTYILYNNITVFEKEEILFLPATLFSFLGLVLFLYVIGKIIFNNKTKTVIFVISLIILLAIIYSNIILGNLESNLFKSFKILYILNYINFFISLILVFISAKLINKKLEL